MIFSTSFSSLPRAFSADFSSCFMFSPTVSSSSSIPFRFFSASSALSSGLLKLLHVLTNSLKFILDSLQVLLSQLSSLHSSLQLSFLNSKLSAQLIQLLLVIRSHLDGGPQVFVQLLNGHLVVQASVLHNLDGLHDIVSSLGGDGELGDSLAKSLSRLLVFLLHEHDPPGQGRHIALNFLELFLGLLKGLGGLGQFVIGLVESDLKLLHFLAIISDIAVRLVSSGHSFPGCLLETSDGGVKSVSLSLEGLHLFPNGVHCDLGL